MSRGNNGMRIQKPRSAPSSPTSDRRSFDSPSKLQSGLTPTTSYRKELRLRNSNVETRCDLCLFFFGKLTNDRIFQQQKTILATKPKFSRRIGFYSRKVRHRLNARTTRRYIP